jgi:hypothetical protein
VLAERTGLSSISVESKQLMLRFPLPRKNEEPMEFPYLGEGTRTSKNTVWLAGLESPTWRERLLELLEQLGKRRAPKRAWAPRVADGELVAESD